ncbi:MAG: ATP-binding protein, partial [Pseudomonadota bacterium]
SAIPVALIVVLGFVLGPRSSLGATGLAVLGVVTLLSAELGGLIKGMHPGNQPPAAMYAVMQIVAFALIGVTITQYSKLFWDAVQALERARLELVSKVHAESKTQAELLESQQQLDTLLNHVPLAVLIFHPETGQLHYANQHALVAHGTTSSAELELKHLFGAPPFSREDLQRSIRHVRDIGARDLLWKTQHASGEPIWWSINLDVVPLQGVIYVAGYAQDITARLAAEHALQEHQEHLEEQVRERTAEALQQQRRLESIIDALPVTLNLKDRQGRYQLSNKLFETACGLDKQGLLDCPTEALYPPEVAAQIRQHEESLFNGTAHVRYEQSRARPDGTQKDLLVTKVPMLDAQGRPESILTLGVDISDLKTLQRDLAAAKTEAERLTRVMSEFLSNMSHEIRTPLHGMLGMAHMGKLQPCIDPDIQHTFERITLTGRHLLGVVNAVLDFSKIEAGRMVINDCALDPHHLALDALSMMDTRAKDKGLSLSLRGNAVPPAVVGDPLRIRQILINLLSNAVTFTERGAITLTRSVQGSELHFAIQDTGIGMHPDAQARAFSPFEQADGSTSRRFGGTGLGLSISRQLARLMGGDIRLRSALTEGSTFTLVLPLKTTDVAPTPIPAMALPNTNAITPSLPRLTGLRILSVDDVDINRDIVEGLLSQEQAEITSIESGKQALALLKKMGKGHFDLVLMDVQMPVMNGMQATELMHMVEADLPIIALTAHALNEECQRCRDAGMIDHLAKPFEPEDMVQIVIKHARRAPHSPRKNTPLTLLTPPAPAPAPTDTQTLDLAGGLRRCGGRADLLRKLVSRFSDEQADFVVRCKQLIPHSPDEAQRATHMLKGTSGNLGLPLLSRHAGELENALITQDPAAIEQSLSNIDRTLQQTLEQLQSWLKEPASA